MQTEFIFSFYFFNVKQKKKTKKFILTTANELFKLIKNKLLLSLVEYLNIVERMKQY